MALQADRVGSEDRGATGSTARPPSARIGPVRLALALLVLVVGAVGYVVFVKRTQLETSRLSTLLIVHPGVAGLDAKAKQFQLVPASSSSYATVKKSAKSDPDETGGVARLWEGSSSSHNALTLLVNLLPDTAAARSTRAEAAAADLGPSSYSSEHLTFTNRFTVPGVPGASGSAYTEAASSTSVAGHGYAIVFRVGRTVVSELVQGGTSGLDQRDAQSIAQAEGSLLERVEPGFTMTVTTRPFAASAIYVASVLLVAVLVYVTPQVVRRRRERRATRQAERARYQYRARGRKAVRRHRPPSWAHPRR